MMVANKTILSISPFIVKPFIHGAITRIYYLNQHLARQNRLLFVSRQGEVAPDFASEVFFNGKARPKQLLSFDLLRRAQQVITDRGVNLILANHIWSGLHGVLLSRKTGIPLLFDNHNVEYLRFKRQGNPVWRLVWAWEKLVCSAASHILCVSEVDRQILLTSFALPPSKIQVAENGVNISDIVNHPVDSVRVRATLGLRPEDTFYLFYGSFTYPPNYEAAKLIIDEIAPRLAKQGARGKICLIGKGPVPLSSPLQYDNLVIESLGFVDDLFAYIKSADVMIAPLTAGSGTRFKILETLACEVPVVTTTIGAEGLNRSVCGENLHILDDWDNFAQVISHVIEQGGHALSADFINMYDWPRIVEKITL